MIDEPNCLYLGLNKLQILTLTLTLTLKFTITLTLTLTLIRGLEIFIRTY